MSEEIQLTFKRRLQGIIWADDIMDKEATEVVLMKDYDRTLADCRHSLLSDLRWKVEEMEQITMIPPGRFGDGRPTQIPTSDYGNGYNQALTDLLTVIDELEKKV